MPEEDLLRACRIGLGMSPSTTAMDGVIEQKMLAVKSIMRGAGVSEKMLDDPLAVGAIVVGVTDIWNLSAGEIKFSPVFYTMITQLAGRSLVGDS
ncbi:hypothetical protein OIN60_01510 [Paenibacillus sp. P96]|uniref:Uncharacterized protein n=1 Tax=Paenibacillus zeirhizosphaerae TaxID=2987519 RepID=A0ABT9FLA6_9BACL|nr:hypothetical protein [Paenibacillus sp. P96]MDP4095469.1 hypothetical protein [Paenibacillus sp. P96]